MKHRPWIIRPSLVGAILAGLAIYAVLAEVLNFDLLGPRTPQGSVLAHRLWECMILWLLACLGVAWIEYLRKRRPQRNASSWPLILITLAMSGWLTATHGWDIYQDYLDDVKQQIPFTRDVLAFRATFVALPLFVGALISLTLVAQAYFWRQPITPGTCPVCSYDLTGNVSGTCPECGTPIVMDPSIPRWFHRRSNRWLPELSLFPDAKARYEAWQKARQQYRPWVGLLAVLLCVISCAPPTAERLGPYRWPVLLAAVCAAVAETLKGRRATRRGLRGQLEARRQCQDCGHALVDGTCPECSTPVKRGDETG
ncbi:MAG TPA: hypothetical protein VM487_09500 [Phycisphaerae bacterium]|nr:hypothetical protein [Phycisphaerae bacterium]